MKYQLSTFLLLGIILTFTCGQNSNCIVQNCQICLTDNSCAQCIDSYYVHQNGTCQSCTDHFCRICPYNPHCHQCKAGFYLRSLDQQCRNCQQLHCLSCASNGNCSKCFEGYYLQPAGNNMVCKECGNGCKNCDNTQNCITCKQGFFIMHMNGGAYCQSCELNLCRTCDSFGNCLSCFNGSFLTTDDKKTSRCFSCVDPNCESCQNLAGLCIVCSTGYYFSKTTQTQCLSCSKNGCSVCTNPSNCTACLDGYILAQNQCKACETENCKFCGYGVCTECMKGYFLKPIDQKLSCASCSTINCRNCYNNGTCYQCLSKYYLARGGCMQCRDTNCDNCPANICLTCIQGYGILQGSNDCQSCTQPKCSVCDKTGKCLVCLKNMYLIDGECQSCSVSNCQQCQQNNVRACSLCESGYFLQEQKCRPCADNNCSKCIASNGICSECLDNFYLNKGKCLKCHLDRCAFCVLEQEQVKCSACIEGYFWNKQSSECSLNLYEAVSAPPLWLMVSGLIIIIVALLFAYRYMLKRHLEAQANQPVQNQPYQQFQEIS